MGERLAELEARLASIGELRELVGAMRALAAARLQHAQALLAPTRAYSDVVARALAEAVALLPSSRDEPAVRAPQGRILFCAEHGFAGAFSSRVFEEACRAARPLPLLFVVGSRGVAQLAERRLDAAWTMPMATQIAAVTTTAQRIAEELFRRFSAGRLARVDMVFTHLISGSAASVQIESLLPMDLRGAFGGRPVPPVINLPPAILVERLMEEYLFAQLSRAATESFASENAARLSTMQSARLHIDDKLEELTRVERRARQDETTNELLDVVTGAATVLREA